MRLVFLPPYPSQADRNAIATADWQAYTEVCNALCHVALQLLPGQFCEQILIDSPLANFIKTYICESANEEVRELDEREKELKQKCFLLLHRIWTSHEPVPGPLTTPEFLESLCTAYGSVPALPALLDEVWLRLRLDESSRFLMHKDTLVRNLESKNRTTILGRDNPLHRTAMILRCCSQYGRFLMVGSDFLDSLRSSWSSGAPALCHKAAVVAYYALKSLMEKTPRNMSSLIDHLYTLRADNDAKSSPRCLLLDLLSDSPFLHKFRAACQDSGSGRAMSMLKYLQGLDVNPKRHGTRIAGRKRKGKGKTVSAISLDGSRGISIHRISLVTQIQDLFPDLESKYIITLLNQYNDDTERITAHLVDNSLSSTLSNADRTGNL